MFNNSLSQRNLNAIDKNNKRNATVGSLHFLSNQIYKKDKSHIEIEVIYVDFSVTTRVTTITN